MSRLLVIHARLVDVRRGLLEQRRRYGQVEQPVGDAGHLVLVEFRVQRPVIGGTVIRPGHVEIVRPEFGETVPFVFVELPGAKNATIKKKTKRN